MIVGGVVELVWGVVNELAGGSVSLGDRGWCCRGCVGALGVGCQCRRVIAGGVTELVRKCASEPVSQGVRGPARGRCECAGERTVTPGGVLVWFGRNGLQG